MAAKYSRLPTQDSSEHSAIDFGSYFTYEDREPNTTGKYPKYFSYAKTQKFHSIFKYDRIEADNMASIETVNPGPVMRCCASFMTFLSYAVVFVTFPVSAWFCLKKVQEYERIVVYRLGRLLAVKGPDALSTFVARASAGHLLILPCLDEWTRLDIRTRAFSIPPLKVLTCDSGAIEIGGEVYFSIRDPVLAVGTVKDLNYSMRTLAQTVLQRQLGAMPFSDIESDKTGIIDNFMKELNTAVKKWGISISKVEMSPLKVLSKPNPLMAGLPGGGPNPMAMLSNLLMPQGASSSQPMIVPGLSMAGHIPGISAPNLATHIPGQTTDHVVNMGDTATETLLASEGETPMTAADLVGKVKPYLGAHLVQEYNTIYKFNVKGEHGGVFYLDLKHGEGSVGAGEPLLGVPDVTLTLDHDDLQEMFNGKLNAFHSYMRGDLRVEGDLRDAMNLQSLVEKLRN